MFRGYEGFYQKEGFRLVVASGLDKPLGRHGTKLSLHRFLVMNINDSLLVLSI